MDDAKTPPEPEGSRSVPIVDWLLSDGRRAASLGALLDGLCGRLLAQSLPLYRASMHIRTLHPQVAANRILWRRGETAAETSYGHEDAVSDLYFRSPLYAVYSSGRMLRCRIDPAMTRFDFPILADLQQEGITDYLVAPFLFSDGRTHATTWSTTAPAGFADADIQTVTTLLPALAAVSEVQETRRMTRALLDTYLGHEAGRRVLNGSIKRGDGQTIAAALWYCDLRDFTGLSDRLERDEVIDLLNEYFGCMAGPVEAHGGEVLKFIGDGMLAIFPIMDDLDRDRACKWALAELDRVNDRRRAGGKPPLRIGLALHTGAVMYGNIGAPERLDFTVIGPAVNLVSRIEGLCPVLGKPLLTSARFASPCGSTLVSLGRHRLKGIAEAQEIFTLPQLA